MARESTAVRPGLRSLVRLLGIVSLNAVSAAAVAQSFSISPAVVAGAPGTAAAPFVEIVFDTSVSSDVADMEIPSEPGRWQWLSAELIPQDNYIASCTVSAGRLQVLASGIFPEPGPVRSLRVCRARLAVAENALVGQFALPGVRPTMNCVDMFGGPVPCGFTAGSLLIGPRDGTATMTYAPAPGSILDLGLVPSSITLGYSPGSPGDGIAVTSCALVGDDVLRPLVISSPFLGFAGPTPQSAAITVQCRGGLAPGSATLTCAEQLNQLPVVSRSWELRCPESRTPPSVSYGIAPGQTIALSGASWSGELARADFGAQILGNGIGIGIGATSSVSGCRAVGPFSAGSSPSVIQAEGSAGALGWISVSCITLPETQTGTLTCDERRGSALTVRAWPIECPARPPQSVFLDGFEAGVVR